MIAALYIDPKRGPYPSIPGVECWGLPDRDATLYAGPWPVVAHPPCAPWSSLRHLCPGKTTEKQVGIVAVAQVRRWGGVLEQPAYSMLFKACSLPFPGGLPDEFGGYTIEVNQCDWGHAAQKKTWLYIVGTNDLPPFPPPGKPTHWVSGTYTPGQRGTVPEGFRVLPPRLRHLTPPAFAEWLVEAARRSQL